ncbi:MAG: hypothetical protein M1822_006066 [Bathelium mastoideum]|nr:MAG: hypothetical protein M1822_006066 [Bathelium mastoideum]
MDPATAFSVACGALQLTQQCIQGVKTAKEIYKSASGLTSTNERMERDVKDVEHASASVKNGLLTLQLSIELCSLLDRLRLGKQGKQRHLFKKLKDNYVQKNNIKDFEEQLERCRRQLDTNLLVVLSEEIDRASAVQREILRQVDLSVLQQSKAFSRFDRDFRTIIEQLKETAESVNQHTSNVVIQSHDNFIHRDMIQNLIDSLSFDDIYLRQSQITGAWPDTFTWLFSTANAKRRLWSNFVYWLESDNDLYWINGKVGSGKSTLMKFVADSPETQTHLCRWSRDKALVMLKFFFWRNGTREQRSISGLLRSLIVQIIEFLPSQADELLKHFSISDPSYKNGVNSGFKFPARWEPQTLSDALRFLLRNVSERFKVCFILDGLDEFEDMGQEEAMLINLVHEFSQLEHVKLLISSRPEPHLIAAFSSFPNLRLQDLNQDDIGTFVLGKLEKSPRMQRKLQCTSTEPARNEAENFAATVRYKADGVFMWAALAVRELLNGLAKMDTLEQLRERLEHLDSRLERLFEQMVEAIDVVHISSAAALLNYVIDEGNCSLFGAACAIGWIKPWLDLPACRSDSFQPKKALDVQQKLEDLIISALIEDDSMISAEEFLEIVLELLLLGADPETVIPKNWGKLGSYRGPGYHSEKHDILIATAGLTLWQFFLLCLTGRFRDLEETSILENIVQDFLNDHVDTHSCIPCEDVHRIDTGSQSKSKSESERRWIFSLSISPLFLLESIAQAIGQLGHEILHSQIQQMKASGAQSVFRVANVTLVQIVHQRNTLSDSTLSYNARARLYPAYDSFSEADLGRIANALMAAWQHIGKTDEIQVGKAKEEVDHLFNDIYAAEYGG